MKEHLHFGYVSRAFGLHGDVAVRTFDPESTVLSEVKRVLAHMTDGTAYELTLERVADGSQGELRVTFAEVSDREEAEALKGAKLFVWRVDLKAPPPGQFFQGDLVGLSAVTADGTVLGPVEEVWSSGPVPNLVIRTAQGELMVPFAEEFVTRVDLATKTVTIVPPEYS